MASQPQLSKERANKVSVPPWLVLSPWLGRSAVSPHHLTTVPHPP